MDLFVPVLVAVAVVLLLVVIIGGPGYLITVWRRRAVAAAVVRAQESPAAPRYERATLESGTSHAWRVAFAETARVVQKEAQGSLDRIDAALAAFMAGPIEPLAWQKDLTPVVLPAVEAIKVPEGAPRWSAVDIALFRLRVGIREPIGASRTTEADTATWDVRGLRQLLALEDVLASA